LGQAGLQDPNDLGLCSHHSQATWVRCPFSAPSFLGMEGDARPKLLITITITIIIIIIIIIIDFTL
jgi:hypothetical protein